jgi:hypothetical protein
MSDHGSDPVPSSIVLTLDEAFRVLEAPEDARLELRDARAVLGLTPRGVASSRRG